MRLLLLISAAYLLGSIPFSYIFPKVKGKDTKREGTGNVGATNALITAGPWLALFALLGDMAKGFLAVGLARYYGLNDLGIALCALAVVAGHDFSLFLKFKGGKGVATTGGILFALDPIFATLVILVWVLAMTIIRYFIPSTVLILCFIPVLMWLGSWRWEYIVFALVNAGLGIYTHRANLRNFFNGSELNIQQSIEKHLRK